VVQLGQIWFDIILIDTNSTDEGLKLKNAPEARALLQSRAGWHSSEIKTSR
jgi:hypothetical protein